MTNQSIGITDLHSDLPLALLHRRFEGVTGSPARMSGCPCCARAASMSSSARSTSIPSFLPEGALRRAVQTGRCAAGGDRALPR